MQLKFLICAYSFIVFLAGCERRKAIPTKANSARKESNVCKGDGKLHLYKRIYPKMDDKHAEAYRRKLKESFSKPKMTIKDFNEMMEAAYGKDYANDDDLDNPEKFIQIF